MTTIIKPNQNKLLITWRTLTLLIGLLAMVFVGILFYNQIVNLQHLIGAQFQFLEKAKLANVDFKNQLYQLVDSKNLLGLASRLGMVKINNPEFLQLDSPVAKK